MQFVRSFLADARHAQITVLFTLITLGIIVFDFNIPVWHAFGVLGSALAMQALCAWVVYAPFDWRSPVITAASLTLLLRTDQLAWSVLAGVIAIGSKFVIRANGKHIFNPANFAIVVLALGAAGAWISPGQWGAAAWFAVTLAALGLMVTGKARRWDVSLMYLVSFAAILIGRALWYGEPMAIPLHQLQSGALLIFAFFMISDPMTTPNARPARLIHAMLTAVVGAYIVFDYYRADGVILALILTAPLVPILDKVFPAERAQWRPKEISYA
jgi:Na+-transporting NADH:ubiquinone oxidoreductase subunit NqrB